MATGGSRVGDEEAGGTDGHLVDVKGWGSIQWEAWVGGSAEVVGVVMDADKPGAEERVGDDPGEVASGSGGCEVGGEGGGVVAEWDGLGGGEVVAEGGGERMLGGL